MLCVDTEQQESNTEEMKQEINIKRVGNTNIILNEDDNTNTNQSMTELLTRDISQELNEDISIKFNDEDVKEDQNEDMDFEMDDFDALRSIVISPLNISPLGCLTLEHNKTANNKSKKTLKSNSKTKPKKNTSINKNGRTNGIMSSFWDLRNGLTNGGMTNNGMTNNGINGLNGLSNGASHIFNINGGLNGLNGLK